MAVRAEPRAELNSMSDNSDMAGEEEEEEDSRAHVSSFFSSFLTRTSASSQFSSSSWIWIFDTQMIIIYVLSSSRALVGKESLKRESAVRLWVVFKNEKLPLPAH